jgi:hypothetical protein
MKYDPKNELTDKEMDSLDENSFFEYLDSKAKYLKQFTQPLDTYHTKQFLAATKGSEVTTEELKRAKQIGKAGDEAKMEKIVNAEIKLGGNPKFKDSTIKVKTHRSQWFD